MNNREIKIGKKYRHFKGKLYRTVALYDSSNIEEGTINIENYRDYAVNVIDNLTDEPLKVIVSKWELKDVPYEIIILDKNGNRLQGTYVLYTGLYEPYGFYVRKVESFISLTDKVKYPNSTQKYRFEYTDI